MPFPTASNPQELDFSCVTPPSVAADPLNPYGDVAIQENPIGSSNGIAQLEDTGAHGATATSKGTSIRVFQGVNFATSSRSGSSTDLQGLNFVAYAKDAVTWFHYTKVAGKSSPSSAVTSLTQSQLQQIFNGTIDNWSQVGGANAPIVVFAAQEGSGTASVWKTFARLRPGDRDQDNCANPRRRRRAVAWAPRVIFENQDATIGSNGFSREPVDLPGAELVALGQDRHHAERGDHQPDPVRRHLLVLLRQLHDVVFGRTRGRHCGGAAAVRQARPTPWDRSPG